MIGVSRFISLGNPRYRSGFPTTFMGCSYVQLPSENLKVNDKEQEKQQMKEQELELDFE